MFTTDSAIIIYVNFLIFAILFAADIPCSKAVQCNAMVGSLKKILKSQCSIDGASKVLKMTKFNIEYKIIYKLDTTASKTP